MLPSNSPPMRLLSSLDRASKSLDCRMSFLGRFRQTALKIGLESIGSWQVRNITSPSGRWWNEKQDAPAEHHAYSFTWLALGRCLKGSRGIASQQQCCYQPGSYEDAGRLPVLVYVVGYAVYWTLKNFNCEQSTDSLTVDKKITGHNLCHKRTLVSREAAGLMRFSLSIKIYT